METAAAPGLKRRRPRLVAWLVVTAAVLAGVITTVVIWRSHSPPPPTVLPEASADFINVDAGVLLVVPRTTGVLRLRTGDRVEILLDTEDLQFVVSSDAGVLRSVPKYPCHIALLCGAPGVSTFAFRAEQPGNARLRINFGSGCREGTCPTGTIEKPVVVTAA